MGQRTLLEVSVEHRKCVWCESERGCDLGIVLIVESRSSDQRSDHSVESFTEVQEDKRATLLASLGAVLKQTYGVCCRRHWTARQTPKLQRGSRGGKRAHCSTPDSPVQALAYTG